MPRTSHIHGQAHSSDSLKTGCGISAVHLLTPRSECTSDIQTDIWSTVRCGLQFEEEAVGLQGSDEAIDRGVDVPVVINGQFGLPGKPCENAFNDRKRRSHPRIAIPATGVGPSACERE